MVSELTRLFHRIQETMIAARHRFFRELRALRAERAAESEKTGILSNPSFSVRLADLSRRIDLSRSRAEARRKKIPPLSFDPELPIVEHKEKIAESIRAHRVVIVCGETGSGKSTQLPKICLELGRGIFGMIGHTQPRRLAARSIAQRLADELGTRLGDGVGFKIRFTDTIAEQTHIKVMTDGVLLAESHSDPLFRHYDTIILDEAHERSLNIDFLLGMMKRLLTKRKDLKLIITSATIDAKRFAEHFSFEGKPAPIIEVSGRAWPIEIRYRPPEEQYLDENHPLFDGTMRRNVSEKQDDSTMRERALLSAVDECARIDRGDMLIFMPTQRDILDATKLLKKQTLPGDDAARKTEILPLYARLTFEEQRKIFAPSRWRKIVLATNVAESSLTVPGIRYVIDTGTARMSRYSARSRTQRLPVEVISRASADQRAGRCGRVGPGVCIRLYSAEDFMRREDFTTPEIRRTNLASVLLRMAALKLGAVETFPFLDAPGRATVVEGYKTLFELGALDESQRLTPIGRTLAKLPVDPRLGRMILAAVEENVVAEILILAAALEIQDPRERPLTLAAKADAAHAKFTDDASDFLSYLKIWDFWQHLQSTLSNSKVRRACAENFLSFVRMREWTDIHAQLFRWVRDAKISVGERRNDSDALHRAILTGFLIGIAQKDTKTQNAEYHAALGGKFVLWPGSGLAKKKYGWVVAAERVETSRRFLRCVGKINPAWIEPLADHLLNKSYHEPHWSRETGSVHAYQKISLFGLVLVPKRRIAYGPINPQVSRDIFIRRALVEEEFDGTYEFFVRNKTTLEQAVALAAKLRRGDLLHDDSVREAFYQSRIPAEVYDAATLKKWLRTLPPAATKQLEFSLADLCEQEVNESTLAEYPDQLSLGTESIPLSYRYEPGADDDGLTATCSPETLCAINAAHAAGWLVPGLLAPRITALLKSLPKEHRRPLVPIPDTARDITKTLPFGDGDFYTTLAREASRRAGCLITPSDFCREKLPPELLLNWSIVDTAGTVLHEGRNLDAITASLGIEAKHALAVGDDPVWTRDGLVSWDFGLLPESVSVVRGGRTLTAYPGLVDAESIGAKSVGGEPNTVSLRLFDRREKAEQATQSGCCRLFFRAHRRELFTQTDWLPDANRLRSIAATLPGFDFSRALAELIVQRAMQPETFVAPRNEGDFHRIMGAAASRLGGAVTEITPWTKHFLNAYQAARLAIEKNRSPMFSEARADCRSLFERLLFEGFHRVTPWERLREYPRYFHAVAVRYESLAAGKNAHDHAASVDLAEWWDRFRTLSARHAEAGIDDPHRETFRWMLEEYTVSLFAQKLGTSIKVSPQRLERQWEKIVGTNTVEPKR